MAMSSLTEVLRETLALFDASGTPYTTTEVAERLDLGRRSTYERLERLVEHGELETKKVGANGRVWWRTTTARTGDRSPTTAELTRQLRTFRKATEAATHPIYFTDGDGTIEYVNPAFEETTGYTAEEAIGQKPRLLRSGRQKREFYEELWETILAGDVWEAELINTTKGGEEYVVEETIAPVTDDSGEIERFVAVNTDITEREDHERRYEAIIDQTYQFTGLLKPDGTLIETNETSLEFGGLERTDVIGEKYWNTEWFQHGDAAERAREAVDRVRDGEDVRQELEIRGSDRTATIDCSIRPVTDESDEIVYLIAEGRDITERVEAEREKERQREQLAALSHINAIVRDITDAIIKQTSREEIERTVCESLAGVDSYEFAWIGEIDMDSRTIRQRTEAGVEGYLDGVTISVDPDDELGKGPAARALRTGEIQTTHDVRTDTRNDPWRDHIEEYDFRSSAAIPIVHEETTYGVLKVYAERPGAFEGPERAVISQLGEVIGHAISAVERKQALMSNEIVELGFHIPGMLESLGVDANTDGRIAFEETIATSDKAYLVYGTMTPDARTTLEAMAEQYEPWNSVRVISEETEGLRFQIRSTDTSLRSRIATEGGTVREAVLEDGDLHLRVRLPPTVDVSSITETVTEKYSTARFLSKRQFARSRVAGMQNKRSPLEGLTDRQRAVFEAAYQQGYFEWPRDASGEEIADSLGIAPPTFSQHLRKAEKTVVESIIASASRSKRPHRAE